MSFNKNKPKHAGTVSVFEIKDGKAIPSTGAFFLEDKTSIQYINNGRRHREDGPAIINTNGHLEGLIEWWWEGTPYIFETWCKVANKTDEEIVQLKLQYGPLGDNS